MRLVRLLALASIQPRPDRYPVRVHGIPRKLNDPAFLPRLEQALSSGEPLLQDLKLKVTSKCNLACQMCDYWKTTREETLSADEWGAVLREAAALGATKVHVSGGEPFLRRDLLEILGHAVGAGIKTNLTTNGTLVRRDQAKALVDMGVNAVSVSLDGPSAKIHDRVRGRPGSFKRSLKTIRWLVRDAERRKARLVVRVNLVLMRENLHLAADMVRLAADLGAVDLVPMPVDGEGIRLRKRELERYEREVAPQVAEARATAGFDPRLDRVHPFGQGERALNYAELGRYARGAYEREVCHAPWVHTFVGWNGDVFLCCMTANATPAQGNVRRDGGLTEVLRGPAYRETRARFLAGRHLGHCHRCDLFLPENALLTKARRPGGRRLTVVE